MALWNNACATRWTKLPVWIHGDVAVGNLLMDGGKLAAVIDFGGAAVGDPACDLVMTWTYFTGKARDIFVSNMNSTSRNSAENLLHYDSSNGASRRNSSKQNKNKSNQIDSFL